MKKILSAALALVCVWFATPSFANCNLFDGQIEKGSIDLNNGSVLVDNEYRTRSKNFIAVQPNTQYVFTREDTNGIRWIVGYDKDKNPVTDSNFDRPHPSAIKNMADGGANSTTFTTTPTTYYIRWYNTTNSGLSEKVQIEEGSTATPYQPYDAACIERCKNLFSAQIEKGGVQFTDGRLLSSPNRVRTGTFIDVTPNTTYTISTNMYNVAFFEYNSAGNYVSDSGALRGAPVTFTTKENTTKVRFSFALQNTSAEVNVNDVQWVQLEQGDTATAYVPYNAACHNNKITIATTKYNETAFGPLNTALANAISVVDSVVSNTITQAGRIATLQAQKQTRPNDIADDNEKCPAGKKCLLVTDTSGVPHWYEIVEQYSRLPEGFTELQYVSNAANTYLDTGIIPTVDNVVMEMKVKPSTGSWYIWQNRDPSNSVIHGFSGANTGSKISFNFPNASVATSTITRTSSILTVRSTMLNGQGKLYVHDDVTNESDEQTIAYTFSAETLPYYLFGNQRNDRVNAGNAVYYAKMYMNDELVMDYIPAKRNRDGAIGFYDLASQSFKQANHGSFIAGPEVQ